MMSIFQWAATLLIAASATLGLAHSESRSFPLSGFREITAESGVNVSVTVGDAFSVRAESDGDISRASAAVQGQRLVLGRSGQTGALRFGRGAKLSFTVSLPKLEAAEVTSGADMKIAGMRGGPLMLKASSGSDIVADGSCETLDAEASSGSDIRAFGLSCGTVRAESSSGADIEVYASRKIVARASSGGSIVVRGDPENQNVDRSSGGTVRFED